MTKTLKKIYHTHGALTFLLAFYPLLPKVVELHTKSYLGITRRLTGSIHSIEEVIKIMFGARGIIVYEEYRKKHPKQILADDILKLLFDNKKPIEALKSIQKMFFDRSQRNFHYADKMRASIILTTPEILREYPQDTHSAFRTKLIRLLSNQAIIDQAIPSQLAFIEVATRLLTQLERHRLRIEKERLDTMFHMLEAKIKAELAGKASAFTAPIKTYVEAPKDPIILTEEDAQNLHEVLLLLAVSPALEIKNEAKNAILEINRLKKKSTSES